MYDLCQKVYFQIMQTCLSLKIIHSCKGVQFQRSFMVELFPDTVDVLSDLLLMHLLHTDDLVLFIRQYT